MAVLWQGRPARLAAVLDAGPRERLQLDAGRSRDMLQVAGRMAQLGGWYLDLPSRAVHLSDMVCDLHERPPGTVLTLDDAAAHYDGAAADQIRRLVRACLEHGTAFDLELPFTGLRGARRWVRTAGEAVRHANGRVVGVQGAQQDITARKQSELALHESRRQLRDLLAAVPDLWIVVDAQHRYQAVSNPHHASLTEPWAHKLGRPIAEGVPEPLVLQTRGLIAQAHAGQPASHTYELPMADGSTHVFEARYMPLPEGATLSLIRDMTQLRDLAEARQARAVAEEAGRRQAAFMSRVSHELRTPLNAIIGFSELLRREVKPDAVQAGIYLGHVLKAGRHMLALVDDLLELQRIEQGSQQPVLGPVALDDVLLASLQMLEPLAASAGVVLQAAPATALVLHAELRSAQQILLNLGSNAIKYGGSGGVVRISVEREGARAVVRVSDSGAGIAPEQVLRLFQPFERLGQERRGVAGTGLGLVISRQLAQAMGGALELASTPGQGTTVTLYLPLHDAASQRPELG
jgi:signal transduction histidine kinase